MEHPWYCTLGKINAAVSVYVRNIFTTENTENHGECTEQRHFFAPMPCGALEDTVFRRPANQAH
jgi:hypothetical protein